MFIGRNYPLKDFLVWTRREILLFLTLAAIPTVLFQLLHWKWLAIPWLPIAMIGTAVAFIVSFKNNASYDRMWEARKTWGALINASRAWGIMVNDYVTNRHALTPLLKSELKAIQQQLIYRHLAWLTALRYQLREPRLWESLSKAHNAEYRDSHYAVPEHTDQIADVIAPHLSEAECTYLSSKKNKASQIIRLQSRQLRTLLEQGLIEDFRHMELEKLLLEFYNQQGVCERIKNTPYPRQFASLNLFFVRLFMFMVPFGMLQEFQQLGGHLIWLNIPFSALVCWVFHTMEKIGEVTENPFEGGPNDVPMNALTRNIEIDLKEMLDETDIAPALQPVNNILM